MKPIFCLSLVILTMQLPAQQKINWQNLNTIQKLVKLEPKKTMVLLYANWCDHCKKMQETIFPDSVITDYCIQNFYTCRFDAETTDTLVFNNIRYINQKSETQNYKHQFALKYGVINATIGFPCYLFFDEHLQLIILPVRGFKDTSSFLTLLRYVNEAYYKSMTLNDFIQSQPSDCYEDIVFPE